MAQHPVQPRLAALAAVFPEVAFTLTFFNAVRARVRQGDPERGDAVQWVILAAVGAMMAIAVGTIIYMKVRDKANSISTDTPAGGTGP